MYVSGLRGTQRKELSMDNVAIDMNEFEITIRADERAKVMHEIRERKLAIMAEKKKRLCILKQYAIQRVMGFILAAGSIAVVAAGLTYDVCTQSKDGTILLITVPLGLYMMFTKELCFNQ